MSPPPPRFGRADFSHLDCPGVLQVAKNYAGSPEAGGVCVRTVAQQVAGRDLGEYCQMFYVLPFEMLCCSMLGVLGYETDLCILLGGCVCRICEVREVALCESLGHRWGITPLLCEVFTKITLTTPCIITYLPHK